MKTCADQGIFSGGGGPRDIYVCRWRGGVQGIFSVILLHKFKKFEFPMGGGVWTTPSRSPSIPLRAWKSLKTDGQRTTLKNCKNPWCEAVKKILNKCGLTYRWYENSINIFLKSKVFNILLAQFKQSWYSELRNFLKDLNHRLFKKHWTFSAIYWICQQNYVRRIVFLKLVNKCKTT